MSKQRVEKIKQWVPRQLTKDERIESGVKAIEYEAELAGLVLDFEDQKSRYKEKQGAIMGRIRESKKELHSGERVEEKECDRTYDYECACIRIVVCETGELLSERPMTEEERQMEIAEEEQEKASQKKKGKNRNAA